MEFREVIDKRKTSREWTNQEVEFEAIKIIIVIGSSLFFIQKKRKKGLLLMLNL